MLANNVGGDLSSRQTGKVEPVIGGVMRYIIGAVVVCLLAAPSFAQSTDTPVLRADESVVRIKADGHVERMPDFLGLAINIRSEGSSPGEVAAANAAKLKRLMADLQSLGIEEGWIGAEDFEANPIYAEMGGTIDRRSSVMRPVKNSQSNCGI
jgi:uncharacterized protein YggE